MQLDYGSSFGPRVVMHPLGLKEEATWLDESTVALVELVAHADSKGSAHYCDVNIGWMPVRADLRARRPFETDSV